MTKRGTRQVTAPAVGTKACKLDINKGAGRAATDNDTRRSCIRLHWDLKSQPWLGTGGTRTEACELHCTVTQGGLGRR